MNVNNGKFGANGTTVHKKVHIVLLSQVLEVTLTSGLIYLIHPP